METAYNLWKAWSEEKGIYPGRNDHDKQVESIIAYARDSAPFKRDITEAMGETIIYEFEGHNFEKLMQIPLPLLQKDYHDMVMAESYPGDPANHDAEYILSTVSGGRGKTNENAAYAVYSYRFLDTDVKKQQLAVVGAMLNAGFTPSEIRQAHKLYGSLDKDLYNNFDPIKENLEQLLKKYYAGCTEIGGLDLALNQGPEIFWTVKVAQEWYHVSGTYNEETQSFVVFNQSEKLSPREAKETFKAYSQKEQEKCHDINVRDQAVQAALWGLRSKHFLAIEEAYRTAFLGKDYSFVETKGRSGSVFKAAITRLYLCDYAGRALFDMEAAEKRAVKALISAYPISKVKETILEHSPVAADKRSNASAYVDKLVKDVQKEIAKGKASVGR